MGQRDVLPDLLEERYPHSAYCIGGKRANIALRVPYKRLLWDAPQPLTVQDTDFRIVAANRDDSAVLITLTVRQLNPSVPITTSVREEENANLLRGLPAAGIPSMLGGSLCKCAIATASGLSPEKGRRPARHS